jgi:hypothetical protein
MATSRQMVGYAPKGGTEGDEILSPKHDSLVEYLLHNPTMKMGEVAAYCGITRTALSIIVHSDLFQARLAQRREEYYGTVGRPIRDKIMGVAAAALDRLGEEVETSLDGGFLLETADKLLGHVMPRGAPGIRPLALQQNFYGGGGQEPSGVSRKVLDDSRQLMFAASQVAIAEVVEPDDDS